MKEEDAVKPPICKTCDYPETIKGCQNPACPRSPYGPSWDAWNNAKREQEERAREREDRNRLLRLSFGPAVWADARQRKGAKEMKRIARNNNIGSVSCATMRPGDMIPAFLDCLKGQKPLHALDKAIIREIEQRIESDGYYESEDSDYDLETLGDALNEYAPEYFYFGAHTGDYGFWLMDEWEERLEEDGGIKVSDLSEIPSSHYGLVAVVNDHGNVTLYRRARNNKLVELWSIV